MTGIRCLTGPTCVIPKDARVTYGCPHCHRVWTRRNDGHGWYWLHTPKTH